MQESKEDKISVSSSERVEGSSSEHYNNNSGTIHSEINHILSQNIQKKDHTEAIEELKQHNSLFLVKEPLQYKFPLDNSVFDPMNGQNDHPWLKAYTERRAATDKSRMYKS